MAGTVSPGSVLVTPTFTTGTSLGGSLGISFGLFNGCGAGWTAFFTGRGLAGFTLGVASGTGPTVVTWMPRTVRVVTCSAVVTGWGGSVGLISGLIGSDRTAFATVSAFLLVTTAFLAASSTLVTVLGGVRGAGGGPLGLGSLA